ncbi:Hypothetical protein PBC10988_26940 [Planctomycetales bacterium 10988]|nr:Hypothetical protein PBC10988_26940 [Planctomycetales bacterium 10988]
MKAATQESFASTSLGNAGWGDLAKWQQEEKERGRKYPISRWYIRPTAAWLARMLAGSSVHPLQITCLGACFAALSAVIMLVWPTQLFPAAGCLLLAWECDRLDGLLARVQQRCSTFGAWLDAQLDEVLDLGLHAALAYVYQTLTHDATIWYLLAAFFSGKYFLVHGLQQESLLAKQISSAAKFRQHDQRNPEKSSALTLADCLKAAYHVPANADVRLHALLAAMLVGYWQPFGIWLELACFAGYYQLRAAARVGLLAWREGQGE